MHSKLRSTLDSAVFCVGVAATDVYKSHHVCLLPVDVRGWTVQVMERN